jgi:hypothetical protein
MAGEGHARRKFYDVHSATKSPLAHEALQRITALYAIESEIRGVQRMTVGGSASSAAGHLAKALQVWLRDTLGRLSGRSKLAQAIRYTVNYWDGHPVHLRRPSGAGHQHCRTGHEADCSLTQKRIVHRVGQRRTPLVHRRDADLGPVEN